MLTDMQRLATFLVMLGADHAEVLERLMNEHPYETEADMRDAISVALERKAAAERGISGVLDREAVEGEHRG